MYKLAAQQPIPAETSFCPGPYILGWKIAPCLLDTISSAILLSFIVVAGSVWYFGVLRDVRAAARRTEVEEDGETRPLLQQDPQGSRPLLDPHDSQTTASFISILARFLSPLIFVTYIFDLGLDFYQATHPEVPTTIFQDLAAHTVANVLASFAWLMATAFTFFAATLDRDEWLEMPRDGVPMVIKQFWILSLITETMQLYQWIVTMLNPLNGEHLSHSLFP